MTKIPFKWLRNIQLSRHIWQHENSGRETDSVLPGLPLGRMPVARLLRLPCLSPDCAVANSNTFFWIKFQLVIVVKPSFSRSVIAELIQSHIRSADIGDNANNILSNIKVAFLVTKDRLIFVDSEICRYVLDTMPFHFNAEHLLIFGNRI